MESWMRELTFHKGLTSPDSCSDHLGSSGFWPFHHRKSEQRVTVICVCVMGVVAGQRGDQKFHRKVWCWGDMFIHALGN